MDEIYIIIKGEIKMKGMEWKKCERGFIGSRVVDIRSIRISDDEGRTRRLRVCTIREPFGNFTKMPAEARLFKSEQGYIGVLVTGKYGGYVKIGKAFSVQQSFSVPLKGISKKSLNKLLKGTDIEIIEIDGVCVGIEK